jgi:hypothetical protein
MPCHIWTGKGVEMNKATRPQRAPGQRSLGRVAPIALAACACLGAPAWAEQADAGAAPRLEIASGFDAGARVMMCDKTGFVSIVRTPDAGLRSPQFPASEVRMSDDLIILSGEQRVQDIAVPQSAFLWADAPGSWVFSGFDGLVPVTDRCRDITAEVAASFVDIAMATAWGMPKVDQRVALFDALEDDLRTRLELAEADRDAAHEQLAIQREAVEILDTELALARMAVCELASQTQEMLVTVSASEQTEDLATLAVSLGQSFGAETCRQAVEGAVFVRSDNAPEAAAD